MKSKLLSAFLLSSSFAFADAEKPINETLRNALYAEEVTRDNEAAAKQYEEVTSRYQAQRDFAATALFRLAEVRRKQDRKEDAIKLYQQLITEFPASEKQVTLAKETLAALGGSMPSENTTSADPETRRLDRIRKLEKESPDQLDDLEEFTNAVEVPYPAIIRHFIAKGVDPNAILPAHRYTNGGLGNTALSIAAADGNLSSCELLLKLGAKATGKGFSNPLPDAVYHGRAAVVELLLKHGADPEDMTLALEDPVAPFVGGALSIAIERGHLKIAEQLLNAGVNVNLAHPKTGLTPLHFALVTGQVELAVRLLEKGANPDAECLPSAPPDRNRPESVGPRNPMLPIGETPLLLAVNANSVRLMESILPKSSKADLGKLLRRAAERDLPLMVKWLLEKGADPSTFSGDNTQTIIRAVRSGNLETVKALLAAGAQPLASMLGMDFDPDDLERVHAGQNPQREYRAMEMSPLRTAVVLPKNALEMTTLLIEAGAKPDGRWLDFMTGKPTEGAQPDPSNIPRAVGNLLAEKFIIPKLNESQTIHLLFTAPSLAPPISLTEEKSGTLPPALPRLLIDSKQIRWPTFNFSQFSPPNYPERIEVWRTRGDKASIAWSGRLDQKKDFPPLFWGDVIRISFDEGISVHVDKHASEVVQSDSLPSKILWNLRSHITIPVKIQTKAETKDFLIRGGLVVFDPTRPELPMAGVGKLARLLSPAGPPPGRIIIHRKNWPAITLDLSERGTDQFAIVPDDVIELATPSDEALLKYRKGGVTIVARNLPANRYFRNFSGSDLRKAAMPTLFQAITDVLSAPPEVPAEAPEAEDYLGWFHSRPVPQTVWLNPDFSNIRIRRINPDNTENIIGINLAAEIAASSDTSTFAEIRALDQQLQPGDIVELSLLGDPDNKWSGLTDKEQAFFSKALNGRVQVKDNSGKISLRELRYRALRYVSNPFGKLPFPKQNPDDSCSSFTPLGALGTKWKVNVRRGDNVYTDDGTTIFLQHGDDVEITGILNNHNR